MEEPTTDFFATPPLSTSHASTSSIAATNKGLSEQPHEPSELLSLEQQGGPSQSGSSYSGGEALVADRVHASNVSPGRVQGTAETNLRASLKDATGSTSFLPTATESQSTSTTEATSANIGSSPEQLFTTTGRPVRSAAKQTNSYAVNCDKFGNPILTAEQKTAKKQKDKDRKEREKAKKAIEKEHKKLEKMATASAGSSGSGRAPSYTANSAFTPPGQTRSGRQVTTPIDRHRSSDRQARTNAKHTKALLVSTGRSDDESSEGEEEKGEEEQHQLSGEVVPSEASHKQASVAVIASSPAQAPVQVDEIESDDAIDLLNLSDEEEDAAPQRPGKRDRRPSNKLRDSEEASSKRIKVVIHKRQDAATAGPSNQPQDEEQTPAVSPSKNASKRKKSKADKTSGKATEQATPTVSEPTGSIEVAASPEKEVETTPQEPQQTSSSASSSNKAAPPPPPPAPIRPALKPIQQDKVAGSSSPSGSADGGDLRRSFSGRALSSLLSSTAHRRPGLGRSSFVPPLHPNRKPAPPPKMAAPMSRKDKEALRKEMIARGELGSDEEYDPKAKDDGDEDSDDESRPKYNPFEEEIEGY